MVRTAHVQSCIYEYVLRHARSEHKRVLDMSIESYLVDPSILASMLLLLLLSRTRGYGILIVAQIRAVLVLER